MVQSASAPGVEAPLVQKDAALVAAYRASWEVWQKQLQALHRVFLEGEAMAAPQLKGLLNREARAKERYDAARLQLLGIPAGLAPRPADPGLPAPLRGPSQS